MSAEADKDGWIKHDGGECPVLPDTMVDYRANNKEYGPARAAQVYWGPDTIVTHYRIVQPASPAVPSPVRQRTVTEIVPGVYGRVRVIQANAKYLNVALYSVPDNPFTTHALTWGEVRAAASTLTQIADAMEAGE